MSDHRNESERSESDDQTEDVREANRPPSFDPEIIDSPTEFARDVSQELHAMTASAWQGRLPRPENLQEFDDVVPGLAREIADDMLEEGRRFDRAAAMDHEISTRVVSIMERESASDISFRKHVFDRLLPLFFVPFILVIVILFSSLDDWAKAVTIVSVLAVFAAIAGIALLKGRMTKNEADVIKSVIPQISEAVASAMASVSRPPPDAQSSESLEANEAKRLSAPKSDAQD